MEEKTAIDQKKTKTGSQVNDQMRQGHLHRTFTYPTALE